MTSTATDQINGFSGSLALKQPVRLATLVDIVLEGLIAIDGIVAAEGDRVLVKAQATPSQNGIYIASTGVWSRAADFDATGKAVKGTQVWVTDGTTQAGTLWIVSAANPIVIDTSALTWQAGNAYQAGAAMAAAIIAATSKSTPVAADRIGYVNSVDNSLVQMTWAQMMAALLPGAAASSFVRRNAGNTAYEHRSAAQTLSDIGAVAKAGDTMTGDLEISKSTPALILNRTNNTQQNLIWGKNAGVSRWAMSLGNNLGEPGLNVGSDIKFYRYDDSGGYIGGALTMVRSSGVIQLDQGQLQFPATANPSSDANTLDDYEEGTWTPTLTFGNAAVGMTYANRSGTYCKVGRQVSLVGTFALSAKGSSTGTARLGGLPFTSMAQDGGSFIAGYTANLSTITGAVMGTLGASATTANLTNGNGNPSNLSDTNFANNSQINFAGTYHAT
jgi:hypothetical protein